MLDNLTSVVQGSQTRSFSYDSLSQLRSASNPESGAVTYSLYDNVGHLLQKTDVRGVQTNYEYNDELHRITGTTYSDGTGRVDYAYDAPFKGKLQYVSNPTSRTDYLQYDALGRVRQSRQTNYGRGYDIAYAYDLTGALTSETYPSGRVINTSYDRVGRTWKVQGAAVTYAENTQFASHGGVTLRQMANNLQEIMSYTADLQLDEKQLRIINPQTLRWKQKLYYEANGNIRQRNLQPLGVFLG